MRISKFVSVLSALTITAGAFAGLAVTANAEDTYTSVYERGTTNSWADTDISDSEWVVSGTGSISSGLVVTSKNSDHSATKDVSSLIKKQDKVKITATWTSAGASGRDGSYDYLNLGEDVVIKSDATNWASYMVIDGTSTSLDIDGRSHTFTVSAIIDTATKKLESLSIDGTEKVTSAVSLTTGTVDSIVMGHYKAGKEGYSVTNTLSAIEVSTMAQSVTLYGYTINYTCTSGDTTTTVKTVSSSAAEGEKITADTSVWDDAKSNKYYITADEAPSLTVTTTAANNVLNVPVRAARNYTYTVNAIADAETTLTTLATGSQVEGESVTVNVPLYVNYNGTLYSNNQTTYNDTFTIAENEVESTSGYTQTENITYTKTDITDVVYLSEGEDISGTTATTNGNIAIRSSNCAAAYAENDVTITSLEPGKYTIGGVIFAGSSGGATITFNAGGDDFSWTEDTFANWSTKSSDIEVTETTDLVFKTSGSKSAALDFIYIVKTGDVSTSTEVEATNLGVSYTDDTTATGSVVDSNAATAFKASMGDVTGTLSFTVTPSDTTVAAKTFESFTTLTDTDVVLGIVVNGLADADATGVLTVVE